MSRGVKWVWPSRNRRRLLFIKLKTLPPSMHHRWSTSGKKILTLYAKQPKEIIGDGLNSRRTVPLTWWITLLNLKSLIFFAMMAIGTGPGKEGDSHYGAVAEAAIKAGSLWLRAAIIRHSNSKGCRVDEAYWTWPSGRCYPSKSNAGFN